MEPITLEVSFPCNWYLEPEAELLWVGEEGEKHYIGLTQGKLVSQLTYPGHRWVVRSRGSQEVLAALTVGEPQSRLEHVVADGLVGASDVRRAVLKLGSSTRELTAKACATLLKLLANVVREPQNEKFRSLRVANPAIASVLNVPGALALLVAAGFEQESPSSGRGQTRKSFSDENSEERLCMPLQTPLAHAKDVLEALARLQILLQGGQLSPNAAQRSVAPHNQAVSSSMAASHSCSACRCGIENDLRRVIAGSREVGGWRTHNFNLSGEYRFHCARCDVDLCGGCYDKWKKGDAPAQAIHPLSHDLSVIAPITTPWGGSSYGALPAPPPLTSRNRRGPFG